MSFWRSSGVDMSVETGKGCPKRTNGILGGGNSNIVYFHLYLGEDSHFD